MKKINFGIMSTAKIGREHVIPAIQKGNNCTVQAIASRSDLALAQKYAKSLNIPKVYGSYEELLKDSTIDAIYNPLPNHMHIDWSIKALQYGKHVLCEKPLGLDVKDVQRVVRVSKKYPQIKIMEAFMYRFHPQWKKVMCLLEEGAIGKLQLVNTIFSYFNKDSINIRNKREYGGGGLYDIGCYTISVARYLFKSVPKKISATFHIDKKFKTDFLCSGVLGFKEGLSTFTCSTQMQEYQNVKIFGTEGYIDVVVPFNPTPKTNIIVYKGNKKENISFEACNEYTLQAEAFSQSILECKPLPTSLADSIENMKVIDILYQSINY